MKTLQSTIGEGREPIVLHYQWSSYLERWDLWKVTTDTPESFDLSNYLTLSQWEELEMECIERERGILEFLDYQAKLRNIR